MHPRNPLILFLSTITTIPASQAVPAPSPADAAAPPAVNMMTTTTSPGTTPLWTITSFTRTCPTTQSCHYSYGISTHDTSTDTSNSLPPSTACEYTITTSDSDNNVNASEASYAGKKCGVFTISSGWSGQFGPGEGFTTLAVVAEGVVGREVVYPAYRDAQLVDGRAVRPDQSYAPQRLP